MYWTAMPALASGTFSMDTGQAVAVLGERVGPETRNGACLPG
jgi:hypothetical protein